MNRFAVSGVGWVPTPGGRMPMLRNASPPVTGCGKVWQAKFEREEVDPQGKLSPQERAKRAEYARRAQMQRMALKSAKARRRRKA